MRVRKTNKRCRVPHMRITNILIDRQTSVKLAVSARRVLAQPQKDCGAVVDATCCLATAEIRATLSSTSTRARRRVRHASKVALSHADAV